MNSDVTIEQLPIVADRFIADGRLKTDVLQAIVDDVREGPAVRLGGLEEQDSTTPASAVPAPPAHRGYRFNSTEADRKQREKLRRQHQTENARTGLYLVPRRPEILPAGKPHPSCLAAVRDGLVASVCSRPACQWLIGRDDPYIDAWLDRDDSTGGRP